MTGHIFIYGEIGTGMGQISVNTVKNQLSKEYSDYVLHIISPGGDVFQGFGIYNILKNTGKKIITHVEGQTASIATLVAFAGEKIVMNRTAEFMIHNPYITDLKGDSRDLRNVAGQLDNIKALLLDVSSRRAARNGKPISNEQLSQLYDNETWLTSEEAVNKYGFVDEVTDAIKAVAKVNLNALKMEQKETWLQKAIKNLIGLKKFRNEFKETLQDGTVVVVMSDDGDWTSKQVITEAGEPLAPGDYTLASGKVISVGDNSTISEVKDAPAAAAETPEDMSKIKELQDQLAAANTAREAAEAKVTEMATAQQAATAKVEARFKALEDKLKKEEDELNKPVGEKPPVGRGPILASVKNLDEYDPMGEFAVEILSSRNRLAQ
jgi:ATP-dependent protease ClpP protease subunit